MSKVKLFLDSGAYSAWVRKEPIKLQEYIDFVKQYEDYLEVYANLDDIENPEKTWANQKEMERQGLKPLPVYHVGEDEKYLKKAMSYEYFAIGGMALKSAKTRVAEFDGIFSKVCPKENNYLPRNKIHGFGMTSLDLMFRYPWWSVDSTSWVVTGRFGSIFVPRKKEGKYIYNEAPWKVTVSNRSPAIREEGKHITTFSRMEHAVIEAYVHSKGYVLGKSKYKQVDKDTYKLKEGERWLGKEDADAQRNIHGEDVRDGFVNRGWGDENVVETVIEPGLSNDYKQRDELNIIYFVDLEKNFPKWPWPFRKGQEQGGKLGFGLK
jgi:hypothetical protein